MRFALTDEQRGFAHALADLLRASDVVAATRSWADGDPKAGLGLWQRLAEQGVCGLAVREEHGGLGATPVDLVVAFEQLGRFAVPGPWVESAAYLPALLADTERLAELAGGAIGTAHVVGHGAGALDADVAAQAYVVDGTSVSEAVVGGLRRSVDPARRLFDVTSGSEAAEIGDAVRAFDLAVLACSAQLLGLGEHLLATTVEYAKQRRQFGRQIGSYQALKHQLADVRIALDFVRPLVAGGAAGFDGAERSRSVSAAKVAASDGAYRAARTALQLHGAIGYTEEHDLSLWLLKVRALVSAWGTTSWHRQRVLELVAGRP